MATLFAGVGSGSLQSAYQSAAVRHAWVQPTWLSAAPRCPDGPSTSYQVPPAGCTMYSSSHTGLWRLGSGHRQCMRVMCAAPRQNAAAARCCCSSSTVAHIMVASSSPASEHISLRGGAGRILASRVRPGLRNVCRLVPPAASAGAAVPDPGSSDGSTSNMEGWPTTWHERVTSAATPAPVPLVTTLMQPLVQWAQPLVDFYTLYREIIQRMGVTLLMLVVIRAGLFIPLPGLDMSMLPASAPSTEGARLARAMYGQASALPMCFAALGLSPYINASILVTTLLALPTVLLDNLPLLARLKEARKEGRTGQAYVNTWINALSLMFAVYMGLAEAVELAPTAILGGPMWVPFTALALVAGSSIIQYCADQVTTHGFGNGSGLVICASVMSDYADALAGMASRWEAGLVSVTSLTQLLAGYAALALAAVYIARTELRLPILQYQRATSASSSQQAGDPTKPDVPSQPNGLFAQARSEAAARISRASVQQEYFPVPLNSSGMMSIIFAGALWYHILPSAAELAGLSAVHMAVLNMQGTAPGMLIYGLLVFALEFLPLGGVAPREAAEYLSTMGVGIKGVVPGEATEQYLTQRLLICKFWGGLALATLAVAAQLFDATCMARLGAHLSATSLLIIVGTIMQSSRQIEALLEGPRLTERLRREQQVISSLRAI